MKLFRKIVDERQELEMMRVERSTFGLMFLGLAAAIVIQCFIFESDFKFEYIAGELVVFMAGWIWSLIGYMRRGLWDSFTKPGMKAYIICGLVTGIIRGLLVSLLHYFRYDAPLLECLRFFVAPFARTSIFVFLILLILGTITKARQKELQEEYNDDK